MSSTVACTTVVMNPGQNPSLTKPHQAKPHSDTTPLTYINFWTKPHFKYYFKNLKMLKCFFFQMLS